MRVCGESCEHLYPAPDFVRAQHVTCSTYEDWLRRQARNCRQRDPRPDKPGIEAYRDRIHRTVLGSEGRDFYTGEKLCWNRLNNPLPLSGGRRRHRRCGFYPSIDHYIGTKCLDFRICAMRVNQAKGAMSHQEFQALCQAVVSQRQRQDAARRKRA